MKRIIKGKLYNSETAESVALRLISDAGSPTGCEKLYRKKNGEFFLLEYRYSGNVERIKPMTYDDAQAWAERYLTDYEYNAIFGEIAEDSATVQIHISMTRAEAEIIKRRAAQEGMTVSAYIVHRCAE